MSYDTQLIVIWSIRLLLIFYPGFFMFGFVWSTACHPAELSSPSDAAISPSIVSVVTYLAVFQTRTSTPSKSCNRFVEAKHTNENVLESFVSLHQFHSIDWYLKEKHLCTHMRRSAANYDQVWKFSNLFFNLYAIFTCKWSLFGVSNC
jgi:hypothetical protein